MCEVPNEQRLDINNTWRWLVSTILLLIAFVSANLAVTISEFDKPSGLQLQSGNGVLGAMPQNSRVTTSFTLKNTSGKVVLIHKIVSGCSCTTHKLSKPRVEYNNTTEVDVTFDSESSHGTVSTVVEVLYFFEGDQQIHRLNLNLSAEILPDINRPNSIRFACGESTKKSVKLSANRLAAFKVLKVQCTHQAFHASCSLLGQEVSTVDVLINFDDTQNVDCQAAAELLVHTNSQNEPLIRLAIQVEQ